MDPGRQSRPWREAWQDALYGPCGFYRRPEGPAGHFTTSTHGPLGVVFAEAIAATADQEGCGLVVDVGAGRGELLGSLAVLRPDLRLLGVDIVDRPADLPGSVEWLVSPGGAALPPELTNLRGALVVAHEWLDVVPCTIAEVDDDDVLREVLVDSAGVETLGGPVSEWELSWANRWWGHRQPGDRVEIGATRDDAWEDLVDRVERGTLVAIDYAQGALPAGTFTAYAGGIQTTPVPDGSYDLTAHVVMESLLLDDRIRQADMLRGLGFSAKTPPHEVSRTDPVAYLHGLAHASAVTELVDPRGLGAFVWGVMRLPGN
jgi:SAM-dependent MidA family methyltransferase